MYTIYYNYKNYGVYDNEQIGFVEAFTAFYAARDKFNETGKAVCVIETAKPQFNIFTIDIGAEWVSPEYADAWRMENCTVCWGKGILTDDYEPYLCYGCRV